jgi:AAA family ATP:ADP antiporter
MFDGFGLLFKSGYLGGIGLWVFLLSFAGTFLYFILQGVVADANLDAAARTSFFANIAFWVGIVSLAVQLLATGRIISAIGTGMSAALVAVVFVVGFIALAAAPLLAAPLLSIAAMFQVAQRATTFGIANLARESLWTVVSREEKFKAKNIIDGAVFRGADALNAQIYDLFAKVIMMGVPGLAIIGAGGAVGWVALSLGLGRAQEKRAREAAK